MVKSIVEVIVAAVVIAAAAVGQEKAAPQQQAAGTPTTAKQTSQDVVDMKDQLAGRGMAAIEHASKENKYLFVFFFEAENDRTRDMRKVFDGAVQKLADRAESVVVNRTDPSEKQIVDKFKVSRVPMPFVLSLAPNGAIIQSFRQGVTEQQLLDAFGSPSMEKCLKALQDGKYVMVCVQNEGTHFNDEAMRGVRDFVADARYTRSTEIVTVNPSDATEVGFLTQFGLTGSADDAITLVLAPPGKIMGTFKGATDVNTLVSAVTPPKKSGCGCSGGSTCGGQ